MTRFFPANYNYNIRLKELFIGNIRNNLSMENSSNSNNNSNNSSNNNSNHQSQLEINMVENIRILDKQFKKVTQFDKPVVKHLGEISNQFNHKFAVKDLNVVLSQNLIFSQVIAKQV